jgi:hypothetical protein
MNLLLILPLFLLAKLSEWRLLLGLARGYETSLHLIGWLSSGEMFDASFWPQ